MNTDELAERVVRHMLSTDRASQQMGIRILEARAGHVRIAMAVTGNMLNAFSTCHGGFIFAFADSAFQFACNSHNAVTVAAGCTIEFLAPAYENDELTADASEQALAGRSGVYDITIRNQRGDKIALFRGKSFRKGEVILSL